MGVSSRLAFDQGKLKGVRKVGHYPQLCKLRDGTHGLSLFSVQNDIQYVLHFPKENWWAHLLLLWLQDGIGSDWVLTWRNANDMQAIIAAYPPGVLFPLGGFVGVV